jgi:acyl-CoA reductase-like NAD-dependent aldehyde dehydrogenase
MSKENGGSIVNIDNFIGGNYVLPTSGRYLDVHNPAIPGKVIARCGISTEQDAALAAEAAHKALPAWSKMTIKARAAIMMQFHSIVQREAAELAKLIVMENGKNMTEALAEGTFERDICRAVAKNYDWHFLFTEYFIFSHRAVATVFFLFLLLFFCSCQWPRETKLWNIPAPCPR